MTAAIRKLINDSLWAFAPTTSQGQTVLKLVAALEKQLAGNASRPSDEAALRKEIDDGPTTSLLVWADLMDEEKNEPEVAAALRDLARKGKWPGQVGGAYRWSAERPEWGGGSSWTLPADVVQRLAMKSTDLGGKEKGRFPTPSSALLAAARVIAAQKETPTPGDASSSTVEPEDVTGFGMHPIPFGEIIGGECACSSPCRHEFNVCCTCLRYKFRKKA